MTTPQAAYTNDVFSKAMQALGNRERVIVRQPTPRPTRERRATAPRVKSQAAPEPAPEWVSVKDVSFGELATAFRFAVEFASTDKTRSELQTVCVSVGDNLLKIAATDTYRLYVAEVKAHVEAGHKGRQVVLPVETCIEFAQQCRGLDSYVRVGVSPEGLHFAGGSLLSHSTARDNYVNYDRVLPSGHYENDSVLIVPEIIAALKAVLPVAKHDDNRVLLATNYGKLTVSAHGSDKGADLVAQATVKAHESKGDGFALCCNGRYLLEFCEALYSEARADAKRTHDSVRDECFGVRCSNGGEFTPALLTSGHHSYVVMPMQRGA